MPSTRRHPGAAGFTLLEVVVVISVLVALAAILVPNLGSVMESSQVAEVVTLTDTLHDSCMIHYMDTHRFPREYTTSSYTANRFHELSKEQTYAGWKGPYLEDPLGSGHNPWRGSIHLYNRLLVSGLGSWDLDLDGTPETQTQEDACVLWMSLIPEEAARSIDEALEKGDLGQGVDWRTSGKVQWASQEGGSVWILIYRRGS